MKKNIVKVMAYAVAIAICSTFVVPTYASDISFDDKLSRIESLMEQCNIQGIDTSYEQVTYSTVKRTQAKLIADDDSGNDREVVNYNKTKMDQMLDNAINNLQAYLTGEKEPMQVSLPDMSNITRSGTGLVSGNKPVFSVGYGHQESSLEPDVQDMNKYGSTNIHLEAGPMLVKSFANPFSNFETNATDAVLEYDAGISHSGTYSLKVTNNTEKTKSYARLIKNISCEPNTNYVVSVWTKYESVNTDGLILLMRRDWEEPTRVICANETGTLSKDWKEQTLTVTTGPQQTSFDFNLIIEGKCTLWLDDISIKKQGSNTELFYNGDFDEYDLLTEQASGINTYVKSAMNKAKENNVGVEFLLSPHYFPGTKYFTDSLKISGVEYDSEDREGSEGVFLSYNVANECAKNVIADYIKELFEWFNENDLTSAIHTIILSNEPIFRTTWYSDYYTPLFRNFLQEKYSTCTAMNDELGTSYSSFEAVSMPNYRNPVKSALDYDWIEFNDEVFCSWNEFLAQEVKKYTDKPVSIKAGYAFETSNEDRRDRLTRGYDFEKLGKFTDISGFDQIELREYPIQYWTNMMFYDYLYSTVKKPMYNSEVHFINDALKDSNGELSYTEKTAAHGGNYLWMGAAHGVNMFSNWSWDEGVHVPYSLLTRPDVINEIGVTALDMTRLSSNLTALLNKRPQVALFYSRASRLYEVKHMEFMVDAYRTLASMGVKVGFVTEETVDLLDDYDAIILPAVKYTTDEAKEKINSFIAGGGKVLSLNKEVGIFQTTTDSPMSCDEHKNSTSELSGSITNSSISTGTLSGYKAYDTSGPNAEISDAVKSFVNSNIINEVTVTDEAGKAVSGIDWTYIVDGDSVTINISNVDVNQERKSLKFYLDGVQITNMKNRITGDSGISTVTADLYEPVLLSVGPTNQVSVDISGLQIVNKTLKGKVNIKNDSFPLGEKMIIKIDAYNDKDTIRGYQYVTTTIPTGEIDGFTVSMPLESDVIGVRISVINEEGTQFLDSTQMLYLTE